MGKLDNDPEYTEECDLADILEWIYQICGADAPISRFILQTLKLDSSTSQGLDPLSCEHMQANSDKTCDISTEDVGSCVKGTILNSRFVKCSNINHTVCSDACMGSSKCCKHVKDVQGNIDTLTISGQECESEHSSL